MSNTDPLDVDLFEAMEFIGIPVVVFGEEVEMTDKEGPEQDPYSYFAQKFYKAFDRVEEYKGRMSDHEWDIINSLREQFQTLDPAVKDVRREKKGKK